MTAIPMGPAPGVLLPESAAKAHPRPLGWLGTVALAMGGSNQCLFLITALFAGQGSTPGQGSATVPLLIAGLLLSYAAAPGWTELVLMSTNRTGGISAACTDAFRPYGSILSTLAGVCYWWGWVPTCGVTAIMSATAIHAWCLPGVPVTVLAVGIVLLFTAVNLCGVRWVAGLAIPIAITSALLALVSMLAPVLTGGVDWSRGADWSLTVPFPGWFGGLTSTMAGLYLIGFGAPAFEAAACHVGETRDPARNVPRAMVVSGLLAAVFFVGLPVVWLGALGPEALGQDLGEVLGPTFAPLFGPFAKSAVIGFLTFNMFHGTLQPLAGASRTLSQLSDDGVAPRFLAMRLRTDAPWTATLLTAASAILFLLIGDPIWLIAAANFTYLIGIVLPSVAVWLLRRDAPDAVRPYRAPRGFIGLGLGAAAVWGLSALLGFEQFGLPTVVFGLLMAYSGAAFYAWRKLEDRWRAGRKGFGRSLHVKLTGAMLLVLGLDAVGYILAVHGLPEQDGPFPVVLADIFVAVALLTITVGIVLPGMIAHSADEVAQGARRLAGGTVRDFTVAMQALGEGRLEAAHASVDIAPVVIRSRDELGDLAESFNALQVGVHHAAVSLDQAREGLSLARAELLDSNAALARTVDEQNRLTVALHRAKEDAVHDALHDGLTGLPNRTAFQSRLKRRLSADQDFAVLFIDLDRFKVVNDSLGHLAGDALLVQVAGRLRSAVDRIRPPGGAEPHMLARFAGDEFTVLLDGIGAEADATAEAERLLAALQAPFLIAGQPVHCAASIGIALGGLGYTAPDDILRDADLAMFNAKSLGKSRAEVYRPSLHAAAQKRLTFDTDMRRALERGEFVLHYQPMVRLATGQLLGFEALVRWQHPERGLVPPGEFIGLAEETGFIVPLGAWVLREACRKAFDWGERFGRNTAPSVSVNLSPRQLAEPDLVATVRGILVETGVNPGQIKLEITESGTLGDPERAVHVLTALKAFGVQISVDDFGTGYSSLSYLHRLPIDILKIDRSFVVGMGQHREGRQVVNTIMRLAGSLGLQVVAEGVETLQQRSDLIALGCELAQGFLFAKPLPGAEADAMAARRVAPPSGQRPDPPLAAAVG